MSPGPASIKVKVTVRFGWRYRMLRPLGPILGRLPANAQVRLACWMVSGIRMRVARGDWKRVDAVVERRGNRLRLRLLSMLCFTVIGCSSPIGLTDVETREPPQAWIEAYLETASCLGVVGYPDRVTWNAAHVTRDGHTRLGAWEQAHRIYLLPRLWDDPHDELTLDVVRHEALHDLTQSPDHDIAPECDPLNAEGL